MEFKNRDEVLRKLKEADANKAFQVLPLSAITSIKPSEITLTDSDYKLLEPGLRNILKIFKIPFNYHIDCSEDLKLQELLEGFDIKKAARVKYSFKYKNDELYNILPAAYDKHTLSYYAEMIMKELDGQAELYHTESTICTAQFMFLYYDENKTINPLITVSISEGDSAITIKGSMLDTKSNEILPIAGGTLSEFKLSLARYTDEALREGVNKYPPMIAAEVNGYISMIEKLSTIEFTADTTQAEGTPIYDISKGMFGRDAVINKMWDSLEVHVKDKADNGNMNLQTLINIYLMLIPTEEEPVPGTILRSIPKFLIKLKDYRKRLEAFSGQELQYTLPMVLSMYRK